MFDVTSSKLLILGLVALLVIGPKDLPALLRTIGRYVGIIKRQAAEFRAQFDEAMRESELEQVRREVETLSSDAEAQMRAAERAVDSEVGAARREVDGALEGGGQTARADAADAAAAPKEAPKEAAPAATGADPVAAQLNGGSPAVEPSAAAPKEAGTPAADAALRTPERSGA